jgi:AcrR family transcriptional regulator
MNENDLRVQRTRKTLIKTLKHLLMTTPFSKITVHQIVSEAMINRSTFYAHFHDKFDLLEHVFASLTDDLLVEDETNILLHPFETFHQSVSDEFWVIAHRQRHDLAYGQTFKNFASAYFERRIRDSQLQEVDEFTLIMFIATLRGLIDWTDADKLNEKFNLEEARLLDTYFQEHFNLQKKDG